MVHQEKHIFIVVRDDRAILRSSSISVRVNLFRFRREEAEYIALDSRPCSRKWRVSIGAIAAEGKPFGFTSAWMAYVCAIFQPEIFLCSRGQEWWNERGLMRIFDPSRPVLEVLRFIEAYPRCICASNSDVTSPFALGQIFERAFDGKGTLISATNR